MANPIGRPTKYDPLYCQKLIEFFDLEPWEDREIPHMGKTGEFKWMDYKRMANRLPTVRGFCKKIGIHYDTFYTWIKEHKDFSDAFTHAKDLQKWFLIENGLNGLYNPIFAKFTAINITDMKDKTEIEANVDGTFTLDINTVLTKVYGDSESESTSEVSTGS
jgi:hypothetical protein